MKKRKRLNILITAGPTQEPLDPVRFISNHSTGTVGYEIAKEAALRRHRVTLISGPTALTPPGGINFIKINTALEMRERLRVLFDGADCLIMAAAVSDFRPERVSKSKISKTGKKALTVRLVRNPDILSELSLKKGGRVLAGFCLETRDVLRKAIKKLEEKRLDLIVASRLSRDNNPFGSGKADFLIADKEKRASMLKGISKKNLSKLLLDKIENLAFNV